MITAAGLGTRMLPASKEIPKEMFPFLVSGELKPVIQVVFEQAYQAGIRDFVFVVGRGKRVIEDHFTPDKDFLAYLRQKGKGKQADSLDHFYAMVDDSTIAFVNQPEPKGFGDAVLRARPFVSDDLYVIGADTVLEGFSIGGMPVNSLGVTEVEDPRQYGVVEIGSGGAVLSIEEKPERPKSNLAVVPYYRFDEEIFDALEEVEERSRRGEEVQLTDAIRLEIERGKVFRAIKAEKAYDAGSPEKYLDAMRKLGVRRGPDARKKSIMAYISAVS